MPDPGKRRPDCSALAAVPDNSIGSRALQALPPPSFDRKPKAPRARRGAIRRWRRAALVTSDVAAYMSAAGPLDDCMLPSLFASTEDGRPWNVPRAALYGAGIGLLAALIKMVGPFRTAEPALPFALELCVAVAAFALLCAGAAHLRNLLARRLLDGPRREL